MRIIHRIYVEATEAAESVEAAEVAEAPETPEAAETPPFTLQKPASGLGFVLVLPAFPVLVLAIFLVIVYKKLPKQ